MSLKTISQFCKTFEVPVQTLHYLLDVPRYKTFVIKKRSGGVRIIEAPQGELKKLQKRINSKLQHFFKSKCLSCVHGFVSKGDDEFARGIKTNATEHLGKPCLLNIDLKDFFSSITAKQVKAALNNEPFNINEKKSTLLALLGTYKKKLPTGSPLSPVLSNIVFYKIDVELMRFVDEINSLKNDETSQVSYTRYADDLTFSGDKETLTILLPKITQLLAENGFIINENKLRMQTKFGAQWVTGVKVNKHTNISRLYIRKLRATLHNLKTNTTDVAVRKYWKITTIAPIEISLIHTMLNTIKGQLGWVGNIRGKDDAVYLKLKDQFVAIEKQYFIPKAHSI